MCSPQIKQTRCCIALRPCKVRRLSTALMVRDPHKLLHLASTGFTGQAIDPLTGHYLLGNGVRAFNPTLMRFNSPDALSPFGEGGLNGYAYCGGDPVNNVDPTGQAFRVLAVFSTPTIKSVKLISQQLDDVIKTARKGLIPAYSSPVPLQGNRKWLDDALQQFNDSQSSFIKNLRQVNRNFASHGDGKLNFEQAKYYEGLALQVYFGKKKRPFSFCGGRGQMGKANT